jgi:serine/threonine protein phosphatase PrpC
MHIAVGPPRKLALRDTVLLASDGLFDNLYVERIVETIRKGKLPDAARRLAGDSRRQMNSPDDSHPCKPDDMTFIAFRLAARRD